MSEMNRTQHQSARLALADGSVFSGRGFGKVHDGEGGAVTTTGEVVFNTAMTGYQEALTDPSYAGQILTMTAPLIGNYGINDEDVESKKIHVRGFVIRELSRIASNYRSGKSLDEWLRESGILAIEGIDTRALTRRIREAGAMAGILSVDCELSNEELVKMAREVPGMVGRNFVCEVSGASEGSWDGDLGEWAAGPAYRDENKSGEGKRYRVVALDCGAKNTILRHLTQRGCDIVRLPAGTGAEEIYAHKPEGLFVSNGPGDPAAVEAMIAVLREVAGEIPTFGICLGHQLLCLALGGRTYKLKFGHRGANQPVKNLMTGRVEITSQNHGFAVDMDSLTEATKGKCEAMHLHLNDNTLAGFRHTSKPIFAVQYHPEASPGPHDSGYLFDLFVRMMETKKPITDDDLTQLLAFISP